MTTSNAEGSLANRLKGPGCSSARGQLDKHTFPYESSADGSAVVRHELLKLLWRRPVAVGIQPVDRFLVLVQDARKLPDWCRRGRSGRSSRRRRDRRARYGCYGCYVFERARGFGLWDLDGGASCLARVEVPIPSVEEVTTEVALLARAPNLKVCELISKTLSMKARRPAGRLIPVVACVY